MAEPFLDVRGVQKQFGSFAALRGASFAVERGELFGLLGPNGAGKTTLLSIIACLADATSGEVRLDGEPLHRQRLDQRRSIGIATQDLALYTELTGRENLTFFGKLYGLRGVELSRRVDEVLELVALQDRANDRAGAYSGGMKRRLNLGVAVMHRPRLLLLDEPTTGVDPQSRNHIFERVRALNAAGLTVIYTSHYMEEVEALCPRLAIVDHGQVIACDRLKTLKGLVEGQVRSRWRGRLDAIALGLASLKSGRVESIAGDSVVIAAADPEAGAVEMVNAMRAVDVELVELSIVQPTLEQVFLRLTEKSLRD
jgi:ABC-2 type transport system ATP-binding protein